MNGKTFTEALARPMVALAVILGNFALLGLVFSGQCPPELQSLVDKTQGGFQVLLVMIVTFYFGSTRQSEVKTGIIAKAMEEKK